MQSPSRKIQYAPRATRMARFRISAARKPRSACQICSRRRPIFAFQACDELCRRRAPDPSSATMTSKSASLWPRERAQYCVERVFAVIGGDNDRDQLSHGCPLREALADVARVDKSLGPARPRMLTCGPSRLSRNGHPSAMQKISAYILTYNEAEKIEAAIASVLWADEVVVVDSFSVDRTPQIARSLGARVVDVKFKGFGDLRNRAIEACNFDWIFSLDADERCTEAVRDEILALLAGSPPHEIYMVPRRSYMMGRWIRGSGWYPNFRQPQLFRKGSIRYTLEPVHEGFEVLGGRTVGTLRNAVWQFPIPKSGRGHQQDEPLFHAWRTKARGQTRVDGERIRPRRSGRFIKHYIFKLGFIDGWAGICHRIRKFRRYFLPLRQALRRDASTGNHQQASRSNATLKT